MSVITDGIDDVAAIPAIEADIVANTDRVNTLPTFKNKIINGGFDVWQRGTSFPSITNETYSADRWLIGQGGTSSNVYKHTSYNGLNSNVIAFEGVVGNTATHLKQRIESLTLSSLKVGTTLTLSATIGLIGFTNQSITVLVRTADAKDNYTTVTEIESFPNTGIVDGDRIVNTFTLSDDAFRNGLEILYTIDGGLPTAGTTLFYSDIQLEEGSTATAFEQRPIGLELSLCQRYYEILMTNVMKWAITKTTSGTRQISYQFKVSKRVTPTVPAPTTSLGATGVSVRGVEQVVFANTVVEGSDASLTSDTYADAEL